MPVLHVRFCKSSVVVPVIASFVVWLALVLPSWRVAAQDAAAVADAAALAKCEATLDIDYYQNNTIASVEGTLDNKSCSASSGEYVFGVSTKDPNGEISSQEYTGTWQRSDASPVKLKANIPIGANADLSRVRIRRISCHCAAGSVTADSSSTTPQPAATVQPAGGDAVPVQTAVTTKASDAAAPAPAAAAKADSEHKPDSKVEQIVTTARRPVYCSDMAPTGSRISRGTICDPPPRTKAERTQQMLLNQQTVDDNVELSDKLMRERMDCEAMRGHSNGATKMPGCI